MALVGTAATHDVGLTATQALAMWLFFNWQSDRIQKDPGRVVPPLLLILLPLAMALIIGYAASGVYGIAGVLGHVFTVQLYSLKARQPILGPFGPLLRGVTVIGQFLRVCGLVALWPNPLALYALAVFAGWHVTRNLIGDVRDVRTDRYELPVRFGVATASWVVRVGNAMVALILVESPLPGRTAALVTLGATWLAVEALQFRFRGEEAYKWGYFGHRLVVCTSVALHLSIAIPFGLSRAWVILLILLTMVLQPTYFYLPGKRFPTWRQLRERSA
jgi:hypothetical protein